MDMQNVSNLTIPEGEVKAIHNSNNQLLWGRVNYNTKYAGDTFQQTYSGKNLMPLLPDGTITTTQTLSNGVMTVKQTYSYQKQLTCSNGVLTGKPLENSGTYYIWSYTVTGLKPNTAYTISADYSVTMAASGQFIVFNIPYVNLPVGTTTGRVVAHRTTDENGNLSSQQILNCQINNGQTTEFNVSNIQIEEGTTSTQFEPFVGGTASPNPEFPQAIQVVTGTQVVSITDGTNTQNFTVDLGSIELCKIGTYQDYIYKSGDDWYVHKAFAKLELDGSENWVVANTTASRYPFGTDVSGVPRELKGAAISDTYIYDIASTETTGADANKFTFRGRWDGNRFYFMTPKAAVSGSTAEEVVSSFKTFLSGHPTKVYFTPTTATDTKITDATLVGQLNAIHQWLTRYGYNATVSGNLPIIVDRTNL